MFAVCGLGGGANNAAAWMNFARRAGSGRDASVWANIRTISIDKSHFMPITVRNRLKHGYQMFNGFDSYSQTLPLNLHNHGITVSVLSCGFH
jgi:hypothetical protein